MKLLFFASYTFLSFQQADAISFHSLPRFSHHDDFSALFSDEPGEAKDYAMGLLFIPCVIMSFFTAWGLLILLFKCIGPKYLGVFSGYPYQQDGCKAQTGRIIFTFSACMVLIFSILVVTKGLTPLENTIETIDATNQDVIKITDEFTEIVANLQAVSREATPVRDQVVDFLSKDICPLTPGSSLEASIRQVANHTLGALEELDDFISSELNSIDKALRQFEKATSHITKALGHVDFTNGAAALVLIPYFLFPALLLLTLLCGWMESYAEGYYFFTTWVVLPIFVLMVIFAYVVCGFAALITEGNADYCSGGPSSLPEGTIENILARYNVTGSFYSDTILFYSNQCTIAGPWDFLEVYYEDLLSAKDRLDSLAEVIVQESPELLSQECGLEYTPVLQLTEQLQTYTTILLSSSLRTMDLLSCKNVAPLYTNAVYDATCNQSITAAAWIFGCAIVISFFSMVMIMFRGAYYPFYFWEGKDEYSTSSDDELGLEEDNSGDEFNRIVANVDGNDDNELAEIDDMDDDDDDDDEVVPGDSISQEYTTSQYEESTVSESYARSRH